MVLTAAFYLKTNVDQVVSVNIDWGNCFTPPNTNMTMENQPFEDVSPTKNDDFPARHDSFWGCVLMISLHGQIFCPTFSRQKVPVS